MRLDRIASSLHPPFDGGGSYRRAARWHNVRRSVIYCGPNLSCCRLELVANLHDAVLRTRYVHVVVDVLEDVAIDTVDPATLPAGWDDAPDRGLARPIGDAWYDSRRTLLLRVPSVASPGEFNILVNQDHPDFGRLVASDPRPVLWDERTVPRSRP